MMKQGHGTNEVRMERGAGRTMAAGQWQRSRGAGLRKQTNKQRKKKKKKGERKEKGDGSNLSTAH